MEMERLQGAFANAVGRTRKTLSNLVKPPRDPDAVILSFLNSAAFEQAVRASYRPELTAPMPFVAQPPRLVKTLSLRQKFKTIEMAIEASAYATGQDTYVTSATYPMREGMQEDVDVFGLDMADCFDHDPTTAEVLALAHQYGYEQPVYEDCLRFGAEHNGEDYQRPCVFLHVPDAGGAVLYLHRWRGKCRLYRSFSGSGSQWLRERCVFFFHRKAAA
jgi:hypothetical protein